MKIIMYTCTDRRRHFFPYLFVYYSMHMHTIAEGWRAIFDILIIIMESTDGRYGSDVEW